VDRSVEEVRNELLVAEPGPGEDLAEDARWSLERRPFALETSMPGVLAAGDIRHGSVKRVASAVGEGSVAVQLVHTLFATSHRAS